MKLSEYMDLVDLNDTKLAKKLKVDRSTVTKLRLGTRRPSWDLAAQIQKLTGGAVRAADWMVDA
jgi:plasmid maintenance system antidote protein VapI